MKSAFVKKQSLAPGIISLVLSRPDKRNALHTEMLDQLCEQLIELEREHSTKVLILEGEGDDFCSGGDVSMMKSQSDVFAGDLWHIAEKYKHSFQRSTKLLHELGCFTIAKLRGRAIGAGFGLAIHCDFRMADPKASLHAGFLSIGLVPGDGSLWKLTQMIGPARIHEFILMKRSLLAAQAKDWGMISEVVDADQLSDRTLEFATQLASYGREVIQSYKASVRAASTMSLEDYLLLMRNLQAPLHFSDFHKCQF